MFNRDIKQIPRIKLNLFDLKPKDILNDIYFFYKRELGKYFGSDSQPLSQYFVKYDCAICGSNENRHLVSIDHFNYVQCLSCEAIYNQEMLKNEVLEEMYKSGIYQDYFKKLVAPKQTLRKELLERRKVAQVSSFFEKPGRILDIGCGSGSFLKECQDIGWEVHGIDPSDAAIRMAKEKYNLNLQQGYFETYRTDIQFDCIVCIGIEHMQDPRGCIQKAVQLLRPGGIFFFECPSADCFLMEYEKRFPFGATRYIESGRHYLFFSQRTIQYICESHHMKLAHLEANGLDIQTILMEEFSPQVTEKILNIQEVINAMLLGDHYRVFLRKP